MGKHDSDKIERVGSLPASTTHATGYRKLDWSLRSIEIPLRINSSVPIKIGE